MKLHFHLFAILLAGCISFAHAEPENSPAGKPSLGLLADPIAQFATPGEEAVGDLLLQAMSLLGVAYRFGGTSPESGLDCSGFIQYVFRKSLHVNLPRTSAEMARAGVEIERSELVPGDLVFYNTRGFKYSHVGLYLGGNKFIHSPRTGKSVEVVNMNGSYWESRWNGARRVKRSGVVWKEPESARAMSVKKKAEPEAGKKDIVAGKKKSRAESSKPAKREARKKEKPKKSEKKPVRKTDKSSSQKKKTDR